MPRRRPLIIVLAITLVASTFGGWALSRSNGTQLDVELDTPGTFDAPGGGIPTAPAIQGDPLPDLTVKSLTGDDVTLRSLIGQPMVINVWYSSCVPCAKELPAFGSVHRAIGEQVRFVGLNPQDSAAKAEKFARDAGADYEILLDQSPGISATLQLGVFPATLLVNAAGQIVELHQGPLSADALRRLITENLGI